MLEYGVEQQSKQIRSTFSWIIPLWYQYNCQLLTVGIWKCLWEGIYTTSCDQTLACEIFGEATYFRVITICFCQKLETT